MIQRNALDRSLPILAGGLVAGVRTVIAVTSFATLIFSGRLSPHLAAGIGVALFSAVVIGAIIPLLGTHEGTIAIPQDKSAAIIALAAGGIAAGFGSAAGSTEAFLTVIGLMLVSSVLTGFLFLGLGLLRLGGFVRFIPYPVIGGMIAGSGWLLLKGSIQVMVIDQHEIGLTAVLLSGEHWTTWGPGLVFGLVLVLLIRRYQNVLLLPGLLVGGVLLFYLILFLSGGDLAGAMAGGLLLGPFPEGSLWNPITIQMLNQANWGMVFKYMPDVGTLALLSVVTLLLYASGIELVTEKDMDLDRELRAAGVANLLSSVSGGLVGYHALSLSMMAYRMKAASRWTGVISAGICALTLAVGASAIAYFPRPVLGGLLVCLGLDFMYEWVIEARKKMPLAEYFIIPTILVVVAVVGFLEGIILGILAGVILFVVKYSRIDVVKYAVSGSLYRSNVDRSEKERQVLKEHGERIAVMKLQGFIFFGTANNLLARVRRRVEDKNTVPLRYLLLDFRAVDGIDSSAVMSFVRMKQLAHRMNFIMGLVGLTGQLRDQLETGGCCLADDPLCFYFEDLDRGLERCENYLLMWSSEDVHLNEETLPERLEREFRSKDTAATFLGYLEKLEKSPGHSLMRQGDESDDLYFLELGKVTANLELGEGKIMRLRTMGPGTVVGEIGFYLNGPRTASVVTETETTLYRLTRGAMERMEKDSPEAASAFHEFMVRLLAERLAETNKMLQVILD